MLKSLQMAALVASLTLATLGIGAPSRSLSVAKPALVDARSIWRPSPAAFAALRALPTSGKTRVALVSIMRKRGASPQAIAFAQMYPGEPAYLQSLDAIDKFFDGFTVGEIRHPFRQNGQMGFAMLNGQPAVVDVSDINVLKNIRMTAADSVKVLGATPDNLRCDWAHPLAYGSGPGFIRGGTFFDVSYPILPVGSARASAIIHVYFQFVYPHWRFIGSSFGYLEKGVSPAGFYPNQSSRDNHAATSSTVDIVKRRR